MTTTTLIRLHKWKVDLLRRELGDLRAARAELVNKADELTASLVIEQVKAEQVEHGGALYQTYRQAVRLQQDEIDVAVAKLDEEIDDKRRATGSAFHELKKHELVAAATEDRAKQKRKRRDQASQDEVAVTRYSYLTQS